MSADQSPEDVSAHTAVGLPQVLREYGQAFRGDWSTQAIDGRSVLAEMGAIAAWIEKDTYPGDDAARERLGICRSGLGHWEWLYCDESCYRTTREAAPPCEIGVDEFGEVTTRGFIDAMGLDAPRTQCGGDRG